MITIKCGDMVLSIEPEAGGSVAALRYSGTDLLRPGPHVKPNDWNPLDYAAFPLVPFSGRIANGRFTIGDAEFNLPANLLPEPHAIHGHGWKEVWTVDRETGNSIDLSYRHTASEWPWAYVAHQRFKLSDTALQVDLSVRNLSSSAMPAGLGWHPYFPRDKARLAAPTKEIWLSGNNMIPAEPTPVTESNDLRSLRDVEALNLDNAFQTDGYLSRIELADHILEMEAEPVFKNMIVYVPPGEDYFCVEPVSHAPDAVNSNLPEDVTGLRWLNEGETLAGSITLRLLR